MIRVHWIFVTTLMTAIALFAYKEGFSNGITAVFEAAREAESAPLGAPAIRKSI